jgi:hypothetical protein
MRQSIVEAVVAPEHLLSHEERGRPEAALGSSQLRLGAAAPAWWLGSAWASARIGSAGSSNCANTSLTQAALEISRSDPKFSCMTCRQNSAIHGCRTKGEVAHPKDWKIGPSRNGRHCTLTSCRAASRSMRMTLR